MSETDLCKEVLREQPRAEGTVSAVQRQSEHNSECSRNVCLWIRHRTAVAYDMTIVNIKKNL